jgi:hypothetical protein
LYPAAAATVPIKAVPNLHAYAVNVAKEGLHPERLKRPAAVLGLRLGCLSDICPYMCGKASVLKKEVLQNIEVCSP